MVLYRFLYGEVPDESEFLRTARSIWLEIESDNVESMRKTILESGLTRVIDMPDSHFYFQAPGGQCFKLVEPARTFPCTRGPGQGRMWRK